MGAAVSLPRLDEPRVEGSHGMQAIEEGHEPRPGPVGLLIRVVLGMAAVYGLVELVTNWDVFRDQDLIESDFWFITLFTLCLLRATCWSSQPSRSRSRWRSRRGHRDASSTRCRDWSPDCVARRMQRRAAASWGWTCSMGNRCVVP
jgi:hypothetical protein